MLYSITFFINSIVVSSTWQACKKPPYESYSSPSKYLQLQVLALNQCSYSKVVSRFLIRSCHCLQQIVLHAIWKVKVPSCSNQSCPKIISSYLLQHDLSHFRTLKPKVFAPPRRQTRQPRPERQTVPWDKEQKARGKRQSQKDNCFWETPCLGFCSFWQYQTDFPQSFCSNFWFPQWTFQWGCKLKELGEGTQKWSKMLWIRSLIYQCWKITSYQKQVA